jgi:cytochrome c553
MSACTTQPVPTEQAAPAATPAPAAATAQSAAQRGEQLVNTGLCDDCHTPKKMGPAGIEFDMSRRLMGHPEGSKIAGPYVPQAGSPWMAAANLDFTAWSGPWGVSFAANLTPDTLTGLRSGVWTEELFIKALRTGKHMGTSRDILPPMPWPGISQYSDEDLRAIWAFLGTIPAITNHVPDPIPPATQP